MANIHPVTTTAEAMGLVREVRDKAAIGDYEAAAGIEKALHLGVLTAISLGAWSRRPEGLAGAALATLGIEFPRPSA